jgi:hypothetical protein
MFMDNDPDQKIPSQSTRCVSEPHQLSIGYGWHWFARGFRLFLAAPTGWALNTMVFIVLVLFLSAIPVVGVVASSIMQTLLTAGAMYSCRVLSAGGEVRSSDLFHGFKHNSANLIRFSMFSFLLYVLALVGALVISAIAGVAEAVSSQFDPENPQYTMAMLFMALFYLVMIVPVMMATWFAPALIILNDKSVIQAVKLSFQGCIKNIWPFAWYGIIALFLALFIALIHLALYSLFSGVTEIQQQTPAMFVSAVVLFVAVLVWVPVFWGGTYAAYDDIFVKNSIEV